MMNMQPHEVGAFWCQNAATQQETKGKYPSLEEREESDESNVVPGVQTRCLEKARWTLLDIVIHVTLRGLFHTNHRSLSMLPALPALARSLPGLIYFSCRIVTGGHHSLLLLQSRCPARKPLQP